LGKEISAPLNSKSKKGAYKGGPRERKKVPASGLRGTDVPNT